MDFDAFLKLFFLYTVVAFGGGLIIGKMVDGLRHWRTLSSFVLFAGALIWGICEVNGFGWGLALIGWIILLLSCAVGTLWAWMLRMRERIVAEEKATASFSTPPPLDAFERNEAQIWFKCNERFC